jgi:hypothetical protein
MLNVDSERFLLTEDNQLNSANDSLYSVMGILNQVRNLGDRYVLLGELRGDLMDVTENADMDLQEINNHAIRPDNPYASTREYYTVINNCNYFIHHVDTSVVSGGTKVMYREYALVKAIRAWTYLQLALNYGKAVYIEQPLLTLEDMNRDYPVYDFSRIIDLLIADLAPHEGAEYPYYGTINDVPAGYAFIPMRFLLGDLYLWKGDYERAAGSYYNLIFMQNYLEGGYRVVVQNGQATPVRFGYASYWVDESFLEVYDIWMNLFYSLGSPGIISAMLYWDERGLKSGIADMTLPLVPDESPEYKLRPSQVAMDNWNSQIYTHYNGETSVVSHIPGDLRGATGSYDYYTNATGDSIPFISKYGHCYSNSSSVTYSGLISLYRVSALYLHYAEAINQLGKPSLAFAVLKYGLNSVTLANRSMVSPAEINPLPYYCDFSDEGFANNCGIRSHGLGDTRYDETYVIPPMETLADSIAFVDRCILNELALEMAFEGNRFHDLMRFSLRENDPAILANRVGLKNPEAGSKLMNTQNWYLPWK